MLTPQAEYLVREFRKLAESIAVNEWYKAGKIPDVNDMRSSAFEGLVDAANKWQAYCERHDYISTRLDYFSHYASLRIKGNIVEGFRNSNSVTRTQMSDYQAIRNAGINLSREEQQKRTGLSRKRIGIAISAIICDGSKTIIDDGSREDNLTTEDVAIEREALAALVDEFEKLPQRKRYIIALHYYYGIPLKTVATILNVSPSKVIAMHVESIMRIRARLVNLLGVNNG